MSDRKTTEGRGQDDDVSPMEAQNTGPAKTGPTEQPLRQDRPGEPSGQRKERETPMKPGAEKGTRDDL